MLKTENSAAGFASEREEIELITVGKLAMGADEGWVFLVHFAEGFFRRIGV
jgi:hypothetical protein